MAATGWEVYDQHHSGGLQLEKAVDLYRGSWGITRSAAAYASSPLGMFFYFISKKRWYHIAKESEVYRIKCMPSVAAAQHVKQLEALAKDPTKKVQSLEVLIEKLTKTRSISRNTTHRGSAGCAVAVRPHGWA
ncbi:Hypothetical protein PHPALM_18525 [Phytophthora palmivora]|uniref:Uncharacterized protein n=1 Tax=Phytophthora palmivora TaxID=4796 RepID=A0A2P4XJI5_9STRA|nr:Hypothetical protein PHPALM_18525 [Phytophthora palmivora]